MPDALERSQAAPAAPDAAAEPEAQPAVLGHDAQGEEFRITARNALPMETVRRLSRIDPWRATLAVAWSFGLIAALLWLGTAFWHPLLVVPLLVVMAGLQQSLFVLAHDAAHYRLYETRWLNDLVGNLAGGVVGIPTATYRVVHRLHHNHLYEPIDPDMPLIAGYPRGPRYLLGKLARDLVGLTAYKTWSYFLGNPLANTDAEARTAPLHDTSERLRRAALRNRNAVVALHLLLPVAAFAAGWGVEYLVLWVLPAMTTLQVLLRLRAVLEHGAVPATDSPLRAARTNLAPRWLRWWLFPHHVNYHIEHHLYPAIPHYRLPAAHAALRAAGVLDGAEVVPVGTALRRILAPPPAAPAA